MLLFFLICPICFSRKGDTWEGERGDMMPGRSMEEDLSIAGGKSDAMRKEMLVIFFIVPPNGKFVFMYRYISHKNNQQMKFMREFMKDKNKLKRMRKMGRKGMKRKKKKKSKPMMMEMGRRKPMGRGGGVEEMEMGEDEMEDDDKFKKYSWKMLAF